MTTARLYGQLEEMGTRHEWAKARNDFCIFSKRKSKRKKFRWKWTMESQEGVMKLAQNMFRRLQCYFFALDSTYFYVSLLLQWGKKYKEKAHPRLSAHEAEESLIRSSSPLQHLQQHGCTERRGKEHVAARAAGNCEVEEQKSATKNDTRCAIMKKSPDTMRCSFLWFTLEGRENEEAPPSFWEPPCNNGQERQSCD